MIEQTPISAPIPAPWRAFLFRQLPVALFAVALVAELLAHAADMVPYRRHDLDLLARNVQLDGASGSTYETVIIGDSVTQDILKTYIIGEPGSVANLTTNQASGLAGSFLLLKRYLQHNTPPRHIILASTPEFLTFHPAGETARVYLKTVFRKPDEVAYLNGYLEGDAPTFSPAVLELDDRIGLKFLAMLAPSPHGLLMGERRPDPDIATEASQLVPSLEQAISDRGQKPLIIPDANIKLFAGICGLARQHDIEIQIQTAPIPQTTFDNWQSENLLTRFDHQRIEIVAAECADVRVDISTDVLVVPDYAMRDSDHLVRHGWTNVYAVSLDRLVRRLSKN